jgi:hypothetical protein
MSRRFQFSLGRLMATVTLVCVALFLGRLSFQDGDAGAHVVDPFAFIAFTIVLLACIGTLTGRAIRLASLAYLCWVFVSFVAIIKLLLP